ncbi:pyridoxamine 5'-phosphate oxidase family protein [Nostoc sp. FACHB-87]|uniref:pyridoxamine 5'-phosphate oxidase family protein n=1 Tax=Nostocales TaxID=1161 RepID=UPI00168211E2|nr:MULTISPECIES: pyridoxamine 5'-phosphate oxidase family protein [Nostocales]MBD2301082.1 pyridoxamine 5'-phosphate oxidase family protein [Nostoc sp. FACHB-190]MBD2457033.1 pyridoxamine 5'-phosphate oxidase family protein [Nostoc sp. FACHB-87]MBD2477055.1 pyridoxamine 5'-phosphate oxidase family protein [Anabaena sp. FACHB-83]MBD2491208.1 pyridoxamine 5'-phosphate oxidase family protein [Aulosira sp. FACHB-615]
MTISTNSDRQIQQLQELIQNIDSGMLTTVNDDGSLHSCPMYSIKEIDLEGRIWFFTSSNSHRVSEIEHNQQVNVSFSSCEQQLYVSISGTAQLLKDRQKMAELWKPELETWFSQGLDQPDLALLQVNIKQADYWDSSSSYHPQTINFSSL